MRVLAVVCVVLALAATHAHALCDYRLSGPTCFADGCRYQLHAHNVVPDTALDKFAQDFYVFDLRHDAEARSFGALFEWEVQQRALPVYIVGVHGALAITGNWSMDPSDTPYLRAAATVWTHDYTNTPNGDIYWPYVLENVSLTATLDEWGTGCVTLLDSAFADTSRSVRTWDCNVHDVRHACLLRKNAVTPAAGSTLRVLYTDGTVEEKASSRVLWLPFSGMWDPRVAGVDWLHAETVYAYTSNGAHVPRRPQTHDVIAQQLALLFTPETADAFLADDIEHILDPLLLGVPLQWDPSESRLSCVTLALSPRTQQVVLFVMICALIATRQYGILFSFVAALYATVFTFEANSANHVYTWAYTESYARFVDALVLGVLWGAPLFNAAVWAYEQKHPHNRSHTAIAHTLITTVFLQTATTAALMSQHSNPSDYHVIFVLAPSITSLFTLVLLRTKLASYAYTHTHTRPVHSALTAALVLFVAYTDATVFVPFVTFFLPDKVLPIQIMLPVTLSLLVFVTRRPRKRVGSSAR